jgi:hypothetical protein
MQKEGGHNMNVTIILISGLLATLAMTLTMGLIKRLGIANADMIRAIGSIFTKRYDNAFLPGVCFKFIIGAIFALFYAMFASIAPIDPLTPITLITALTALGTFHGLAVGVLLSISVAEHHPLQEFREAGLSVSISHVIGHVVYGFTLGCIFAALKVNLNLIHFFY